MTKFVDMMKGLEELTVAELSNLNRQLISVSRAKQRQGSQANAVAVISQQKFQLGDVVTFFKSGRGRQAGTNYVVFENLNRNRDSIQGRSCDINGTINEFAGRWTLPLDNSGLTVHMRAGKKVVA